MILKSLPDRAPSFVIAILLGIVPTIGVLQYRGVALAVLVGLLATVLVHRQRWGAWPWPRLGGPVLPLLAIAAAAAASSLWAPEPGRTLGTAAKLAGFTLLGAAAARAVAADPDAPRLLRPALVVGVVLGAVLAVADVSSGHGVRAAVRGLASAHPELLFGLKPAVSILAVLLPLVAALAGLRTAPRIALVVLGLAPALLIPADAGRISAVLGLAVFALARFAGPRTGLALGGALAGWIILAPLVASVLLPRLPALEAIPPSAAHRVLIWDFTTARIAERPLLGWGVEGARAVPGGSEIFGAEVLDRFGLRSAAATAWFGRPQAQRLPLHPHNAALHLWLELGLVGAVLGAWLAIALGRAAGRLGPGATGALAAGAVTGMLSYGVWQEWWIGFALLVAAALAGLTAERDRCA